MLQRKHTSERRKPSFTEQPRGEGFLGGLGSFGVSAYLYNIKINILLSLTYRFEVISGIIGQIIIVLAGAFMWQAAYGSAGAIEGVTREQMLVYAVVSSLMGCFLVNTVEQKVRSGIRQGNIALVYMKPVNVFLMYLSEDVGAAVSALLLKFLPVFVFSSIFVAVPLPHSALHFMLFLLGCVFSFLILWLFAAVFALLNFWVIDLGPLGTVKNMIILFLSGSVVPVWFFPAAIREVLSYLPFVYIYQFPLGVFIGRTGAGEALLGLCVQGFWILVLWLGFIMLSKKAKCRLMIQGG